MHNTVTMTEGPIGREMICFAIPIMLGNLFQQLYNIADSIIVGNFLGHAPLAAVTASASLSFMMIGFMMGLSSGAGVVISHYYGAGDRVNLKKSINTTVIFGFIFSALLTVLCVYFTPDILVLMGTPDTVLDLATVYMQIFFCGSIGIGMYNIFVGIMQAVGDNKHPLYYLIFSSILNVALDLAFVMFTDLGVAGAAIATIISQFASAFLCLFKLCRTKDIYRIELSKMRMDGEMLKQIIKVSVPSGLQNSIISLANVVVQSYINSFGDMAMAGIGAYGKVESFAFVPIMSFNIAITTFISQNIGAGEFDRAKKGARFGIFASILTAQLIGVIMFIFAPQLIAAFDRTPEVIRFGVEKTYTSVPFFFALAFTHAVSSVIRGTGQAFLPMAIMVACWCIIRVIILAIAIPMTHSIQVLYWIYPVTWSLSAVIFLFLYKRRDYIKNRITGD